NEYERYFPAVARKIAVIPPLLSTDPGSAAAVASKSPIRLIYAGTLYQDLRDPAVLFRLVTELVRRGLDCELDVYGRSNGCEHHIESIPTQYRAPFRFHGLVPRHELASELARASVLVNIGNRTRHQLPSKVVEYIAAGRPILNLTSGPDDSSRVALEDHPAALSVDAA